MSSTAKFIQERKYLKAVSEKTLLWYRDSFRAFEGALESSETLNQRIVQLRERGVKPVSINTWLRCIKAYYLWQGKAWEVARLREEQRVLATLSNDAALLLIKWKPVTFGERRLKTLILTAIDTGREDCEVRNEPGPMGRLAGTSAPYPIKLWAF